MSNQEISNAEVFLLKSLQAFSAGEYNVAQILAENSLSLDDNNANANLFYFVTLITRGNRSFNDLLPNKSKAIEHLRHIKKKRENNEIVFDERQRAKFQEILKEYGEFLEYISEMQYKFDRY